MGTQSLTVAAHRQQSLLFAALFYLLFITTIAGAATDLHGRVTRIYDGDTIHVAGIGKVRLLGIDVPERKASSRDRYFLRQDLTPATLRHIYVHARNLAIELSYGQTVSLTTEPPARDSYGRLLAYVTLPDGRLLNRILLEQGCAVVYRRFDFSLKKDFLQVEETARRAQRGMWRGTVVN